MRHSMYWTKTVLLAATLAGVFIAPRSARGQELLPGLPALKAKAPRARPQKRKPKPKSKARKGLFQEFLAGPLAGVEEIVFAARPYGNDGHWYANFGYWSSDPDKKMYGAGGHLYRLNLRTGKLTSVLSDPAGGVRDPQVHYDGERVVFSYRKGGSGHYHLCEIGTDGTGLRQLTDGDCDDIEPTYLADDSIVFGSSRCNRFVQCWFTQVAILYRCDADGGNVRQISANVEHDNTPWPLPDGRVLFMRWEYVDRSQVRYHHLWTINPDGTAQMAYFGNMRPGLVMIDAKPIPGTRKVVSVFSPGHGRRSHAGQIAIIDPDAGPDDPNCAPVITDQADWRDPYAVSDGCLLVAREDALYVMNARGEHEEFFRLPAGLGEGMKAHEPRPLRPRPRERRIAPRVDWRRPTGELILADVTHGRNMAGVRPGEIRKLLVLETLPKPVNFSGGQDAVSPGGTFTIPRILGTVPVEPDGSAYLEVPALRPVFFVALDANDASIKRMQSFVSVMPGERTSCSGCHERRTDTPRIRPDLLATRRAPSRIEPFEGIPDVLDFTRDVQPILDRHCVRCHDGKHAGRPDLTGRLRSRYAKWPESYAALFRQVAEGRNADGNRAPRTIGTSASPLMRRINGGHGKVKLTLSARERTLMRLWMECGAHWPGSYASLGTGGTGMYVARDVLLRRCGDCHGHVAADGSRQVSFRTPPEGQWSLDAPEESLILRAPLAKAAGGLGLCRGEVTVFRDGKRSRARKPDLTRRTGGRSARPGRLDLDLDDLMSGGQADALPTAVDGPRVEVVPGVFPSRTDPDYRAILTLLAKRRPSRGRLGTPGFRPNDHYVREMKRFGILARGYRLADPIDVFALDQAYWKSFWYVPDKAPR